MKFKSLFLEDFPIIGCIHLRPLPGSPHYDFNLDKVYQQAIEEAQLLKEMGISGVLVENFGDAPFFPNRVPVETVATMSAVIREIVHAVTLPVGVNVLRNDAAAAIAIAHATQAHFIRVNVHMHAMLTDQGIIQGESYNTLRLKSQLGSKVQIWSDINVKHAQPLALTDLVQCTSDLSSRGGVDAIIVTGTGTGKEIDRNELKTVRTNTDLPVLVGSGTTVKNIRAMRQSADGSIVGSFFKKHGITKNPLDPQRIRQLLSA